MLGGAGLSVRPIPPAAACGVGDGLAGDVAGAAALAAGDEEFGAADVIALPAR